MPVFSLLHPSTYACFSWTVIVDLSDEELKTLGFLGPGECLFVSLHAYPLLIVSLVDAHDEVESTILAVQKFKGHFGWEFLRLFCVSFYSNTHLFRPQG